VAGKRVAVLDAEGNFGTLDEADVANLPDGARVLTKQQIAERKLEEEYAAKSTTSKVLGALSGRGIGPQSEAFLTGARSEFTGGVAPAASRVIQDAVAPGAGKAYAEHIDDLETGAPGATTAGKVAGFGAGLAVGAAGGGAAGGGLARALPMNAISALGAPVEAAVGRGLAGVAAKGALGRAASTGAGMAARGALEGAAYGALSQTTEAVLHDEPIVGEKLYSAIGHGALAGGALGGALGFTGSLAASGARGVVSRLSSAAAKVDEAGNALEGAVLSKGGRALKAGLGEVLSNPGAAEALARKTADEQVFKAVGGGFGFQTTRYAKEAARYFGGPEGPANIGAIGRKYGIIDMGEASLSPAKAAWQAAKSGTPGEILPRLEAAESSVGQKIGEITQASGAVVPTADVRAALAKVRKPLSDIAGREAEVAALDAYENSLVSKLGGDGSHAPVQALLDQRKGLDQIIYQETKTLDAKGRVGVLRQARAEIEDLISSALDNASGKVPGELRQEYQALKKDFHGLRILKEAAEDSAARSSKGATFGLGEKLAAGMAVASGNLLAAPVLAVGGKVIKERGNAAAAAFLTRAADSGAIARTMAKVNAKLESAAVGALREAPARSATTPTRTRALPRAASAVASRGEERGAGGGGPYRSAGKRDGDEPPQKKAQEVMNWMAGVRANPTQLTEQLEEASAIIGKSAGPKAAENYTATTLKAINFITGYVPVKERRDPLDPHSVPPLSWEEANRLVRAATYATRPETVWDDFERGVVTAEGLAAAQTLMPESFATFQEKLYEQVESGMLSRRRLSSAQRLRIDKLLQSPAGPDLRPRSLRRLQDDFAAPASPSQGGAPPAPQTGQPVDMKVQQSGFDAVEARVAG
jgi:hypothetical protein